MLFSARLGMAWWWVRTSGAVLALGLGLGALTVWWLGAAPVVGAPVYGWTEEMLVQLARDLQPVNASWLARRS